MQLFFFFYLKIIDFFLFVLNYIKPFFYFYGSIISTVTLSATGFEVIFVIRGCWCGSFSLSCCWWFNKCSWCWSWLCWCNCWAVLNFLSFLSAPELDLVDRKEVAEALLLPREPRRDPVGINYLLFYDLNIFAIMKDLW